MDYSETELLTISDALELALFHEFKNRGSDGPLETEVTAYRDRLITTLLRTRYKLYTMSEILYRFPRYVRDYPNYDKFFKEIYGQTLSD